MVKTIFCDCPLCHLHYGLAVTLTETQAIRLKTRQCGETILSILPDEKSWVRECLISGICPTCQEKTFNPCDDEEDEWDEEEEWEDEYDDEEEWDDEEDDEEDNDGEVLIELEGADASMSDEEAFRILASLGIII